MEERNVYVFLLFLVFRFYFIIYFKLKYNNFNVLIEKVKFNFGRDNYIDVSILEYRWFIFFLILMYILIIFKKRFCLWYRCKFFKDRDFYVATLDFVRFGVGYVGRFFSSRIFFVLFDFFCVSVRGIIELNNVIKGFCIIYIIN